MSEKSKKIICLGGGNAMPKAVLQGLRKYPVKIAAVCAMLDSGGSSGRIRKEFNIASPGDIRRSIIALSNTSPEIERLFNYRYETGELKGHNFANIFITTLGLSMNNYEKAIQETARFLNVKHEVHPVTLDNSNLCAVLVNGKIISGETNIDVPKHDDNIKIKEVYLEPKAKAYKGAVGAIKDASMVVIGPGDLYSSLSQVLLVDGIPQAIKNSRAKRVYVCNLMTKRGETNNFTVADFANEIEKYMKGRLDYIVFNNKKPSAGRLNLTIAEHPELMSLVGFDKNTLKDKRFVGVDLLNSSGPLAHDSEKVAKVIMSLLK